MNTKSIAKKFRGERTVRNAWIAFGGLLAVGIIAMTIREIPSIRRELRLLRM